MTNNSELYFPMPSSSTPPPPLLPPNPQKLRKKRSKMVKILLPKPQHSSITKPKLYLPQSHFLHSCPECFKQFGSEKALYGHMRCHPDRDYRGMIPKPNKYQVSAPSTSSSSLIQQQYESAPVMSLEDHEVASCLLLLSRTDGDASCSFECSSCKKVFGSHQALGGHRASHKNVKGCFAINRRCDIFDERDYNDNDVANIDENKQEVATVNNLGHKCSICSRVFPTGQALGGHKRCHWEKGDDAAGNFVSDQMNNCGLMDLNLPADYSSSSANFNLDLKLGL